MSSDNDVHDFVLGALRAGQRDLVARKRLYRRDLDVRICALEGLMAGIMPQDNGPAPPEDLWHKVCDVATREACAKMDDPFACCAGSWDRHGPGIEVKMLWSDKVLLIRCEPGAAEDRHPQPVDEEEHIIVIAGDLVIGGRVLQTGDYVRIPAGVSHAAMHTLTGCMLFTQYVPVAHG